MKPNFALTLSFDGIGLLHRAFPGWHLVGDVALDSADLGAELAELRHKAHTLDASGLRTKLVLPNDQIKYLTLNDIPEGADDIEARVRAALDGATPYPVDDLAFDWTLKDETLAIAAVARETLAEAEAFAIEHEFHPVCFVAIPDDTDFTGEPFFGATHWVTSAPDMDAEIERDPVPIRVIGASKMPDAEDPAGADVPDPPEPEPADDAPLATESGSAEDPASEPEESPEKPAAFASIRAQRGAASDAAPKLDGALRDVGPSRLTLGPASEPAVEPNTTPVTGVSEATLPVEDDPAEMPPLVASEGTRMATAPAPATPPAAAGSRTAFFTRRSRSPRKEKSVTTQIPEPADEKQRMTIFGARDAAGVGGKPRFLGLILTAGLLLFLIGVAAWASVFMEDGLARFFRSDDPPVVAELPSSEEAEAALSGDEALELASLAPDEPVSVLDDPATEILSRVNPSDLSPDEAKARYAATGIWQLAPEPSPSPTVTVLEDVYQTSLDPDPDFQDAVALPRTSDALTDGTMFSPASPPAADTRFVFDSRGVVLATPDGATTPDGIIVYAGKPPFGTAMPAAMVQRDPNAQPTATEPEPQVVALRPRARPDDLAEQIERNALNGRTLNELASLRPKLRPQSAQEAAEEAREKAEAEALAAQQAAAVDSDAVEAAVADASQATLAFASATPQAVRSSLKPRTKPNNFDRIVQRTKRNQQSQVDEGGNNAVVVSASQRVSPKIPSKASVSKRATQKNALKFKRVNLIGVYGTPSNRRALVRMSNGRYKKVKVGDRLDGGRVNAIGDSDLRYTKGGRNVVLKMPRG